MAAEAPSRGCAPGVSGGAALASGSTPAAAPPLRPHPARHRGRGRTPLEPRGSSRRQRQLGDPSVHLLEGPRPPGRRGCGGGALRSPVRQGPAPPEPLLASPARAEAEADDAPLAFASCFVSSIVRGALSDHVHEDEGLIEGLPEDDDAASACGDGGAAARSAGGREAGRPSPSARAPWEPLRLGGALPQCLAVWPEEPGAAARQAALEAVAAGAATAAAAQRRACREGAGTDAADDFEEVRSLCSDGDGLEEEHASHAAHCVREAFGVAWAALEAQQPEDELEAACGGAEAGGWVIEDAEASTEDVAFDLACGVLDLGIAALEGGGGEVVAGAAAGALRERRQAAAWGSTAQQPAGESVLERLRAEFPQACARAAAAASAPEAVAAVATSVAAAAASAPEAVAPVATSAAAAAASAPEAVAPVAPSAAAVAASAPEAVAPVAPSAAAAAASAPEAVAPAATPAPHTPSCKAKRRVVIGGVLRAPTGSPAEGAPGQAPAAQLPRTCLASASTPALALDLGQGTAWKSRWSSSVGTLRPPAEEAPTLEDRTRPSQLGSLSRSRLASTSSTPALALDLGDGAGASVRKSGGFPELRTSPSLGALRVTKKEHALAKGLPWRALGLAGGAGAEPSRAGARAAGASQLPMGGGSVALSLRMARLAALAGPAWGEGF